MAPEELRSAMRAFGKVSEANIGRAVDVLVASGAAADIVGSRPIDSKGYLGFADSSGRRIAWLLVGHIDVHRDYDTPSSFDVDAYDYLRRVAFPGYRESGSPERHSAAPPLCSVCHNAPDYCECEDLPI